jgi:hypothetical protein
MGSELGRPVRWAREWRHSVAIHIHGAAWETRPPPPAECVCSCSRNPCQQRTRDKSTKRSRAVGEQSGGRGDAGVIGEVAAERHNGHYDAERRNEGSAAWETRPTRRGEFVCSRNPCQERTRDKSTKRSPAGGKQSEGWGDAGVIGEVAAERHNGHYDAERRNEGSAAWETRPTRGGECVCSRNPCQERPRDKSTKRTPPAGEQGGRRRGSRR